MHHTAAHAEGLSTLLPEMVSPADGTADKPLGAVVVGDVVLVKPGQRVPVDGIVLSGGSSVDESIVTGESMPVLKAVGASVTAGTTNQSGVLTVRTSRLASECAAAQVSNLVSHAQSAGHRQLFLERFAKVYTGLVLLAGLLLATVPLGWCGWGDAPGASGAAANTTSVNTEGGSAGGHGAFDADSPTQCAWWLRRAIALTVLSCPCSLVVAMPVTYACGIGALAKWGILVKAARQMELLASLKHLCVDKTGTLTEGRFRLRQISLGAAAGGDLPKLMALAAATEKNSSHPIAAAFLEFADSLGVHPPPAADFELLEGEGVRATVDGVVVHVGSASLARRLLNERAEKEELATPAVQSALAAHVAAANAVAEAEKDAMPRRMVNSLRKTEEAAREALRQAEANAMKKAKEAKEQAEPPPLLTPPAPPSAQVDAPGHQLRDWFGRPPSVPVMAPGTSMPPLPTCHGRSGCGDADCKLTKCCGKGCDRRDQCCGRQDGCCARGGCGENGCTHKPQHTCHGRSGCGDADCKLTKCCGKGCDRRDQCCGRQDGCCARGGCGENGCTHKPQPLPPPVYVWHGDEAAGVGGDKVQPVSSPPLALPPRDQEGGGTRAEASATSECAAPKAKGPTDLSLESLKPRQWQTDGASVLWVLLDGRLAAACQLSDQIRGETPRAIKAISSLGVRVTMLTGDAEVTALAVAAQANISTAHTQAGMKPQDKLAAVQALRKSGVTGMLGDGVNDGPALAAADVGIAMGVGGTALASEAAGVVLMTNDLRRVADAVSSAVHTTRVLRLTVTFALLIKLVPLSLMFSSGSAGDHLVATAVGSDVVGIIAVLGGAVSLLHRRKAASKFAAEPCTNNETSTVNAVKIQVQS